MSQNADDEWKPQVFIPGPSVQAAPVLSDPESEERKVRHLRANIHPSHMLMTLKPRPDSSVIKDEPSEDKVEPDEDLEDLPEDLLDDPALARRRWIEWKVARIKYTSCMMRNELLRRAGIDPRDF
jgi:hypothetical protein